MSTVLSHLLFSLMVFVCFVADAVVILNLELLTRPPADLCKMHLDVELSDMA